MLESETRGEGVNDNVSPWGQTHEERIDELEAYVERLDAQIAALKAERDAARAWASAWRKAAEYERATTMWPPTVARAVRSYRASGSLNRRASRAADARRAAEAAEAMERR